MTNGPSKKYRGGLGAAFALAGALASSAVCAETVAVPRVLPESELRNARAGFELAGLEISLGADLRTYLDGQLALRTVIRWDGNQPTTERWESPLVTPADATAVGGVFANGNLSFRIGAQDVFVANDGQTALLQPDDGHLQNIVLNTASNVEIRQEADVTIGLSNFQAFQAAITPDVLLGGLNESLSFSAIGAAGS